MNNQDDQIKLRQQLALYTDQFIILSDNPAWQVLSEQYPELEGIRQSVVTASDSLWFAVRSRVISQGDM